MGRKGKARRRTMRASPTTSGAAGPGAAPRDRPPRSTSMTPWEISLESGTARGTPPSMSTTESTGSPPSRTPWAERKPTPMTWRNACAKRRTGTGLRAVIPTTFTGTCSLSGPGSCPKRTSTRRRAC